MNNTPSAKAVQLVAALLWEEMLAIDDYEDNPHDFKYTAVIIDQVLNGTYSKQESATKEWLDISDQLGDINLHHDCS